MKSAYRSHSELKQAFAELARKQRLYHYEQVMIGGNGCCECMGWGHSYYSSPGELTVVTKTCERCNGRGRITSPIRPLNKYTTPPGEF